MTFVSTDPQSHKGNTNTWLTPLWLIDSLGEFDLDPCGLKHHKTAKKIIQIPNDGLSEQWFGRVWLNPPYGKEQQAWLKKIQTHKSGIALIFNRIETKWIQPFLENGFFAIQGRIKFLTENKNEMSNAGCGSILIPFSDYDREMILKSGLKGNFFYRVNSGTKNNSST